MPPKSGVYLLHFDQPYHHARHYLGYADDILERVKQHRAGQAARLTQVIREAGIGFTLARLWPGKDRHFERKLKNRKEAPALCPICNPKRARSNANIFPPDPDVNFYR